MGPGSTALASLIGVGTWGLTARLIDGCWQRATFDAGGSGPEMWLIPEFAASGPRRWIGAG
jgi:hypothetical protein